MAYNCDNWQHLTTCSLSLAYPDCSPPPSPPFLSWAFSFSAFSFPTWRFLILSWSMPMIFIQALPPPEPIAPYMVPVTEEGWNIKKILALGSFPHHSFLLRTREEGGGEQRLWLFPTCLHFSDDHSVQGEERRGISITQGSPRFLSLDSTLLFHSATIRLGRNLEDSERRCTFFPPLLLRPSKFEVVLSGSHDKAALFFRFILADGASESTRDAWQWQAPPPLPCIFFLRLHDPPDTHSYERATLERANFPREIGCHIFSIFKSCTCARSSCPL